MLVIQVQISVALLLLSVLGGISDGHHHHSDQLGEDQGESCYWTRCKSQWTRANAKCTGARHARTSERNCPLNKAQYRCCMKVKESVDNGGDLKPNCYWTDCKHLFTREAKCEFGHSNVNSLTRKGNCDGRFVQFHCCKS